MNCYTVGGYAEDYQDENGKQYYYNSSYIIDREGGLFLNYRKSFLFETDKIWASERQGRASRLTKYPTMREKNSKPLLAYAWI